MPSAIVQYITNSLHFLQRTKPQKVLIGWTYPFFIPNSPHSLSPWGHRYTCNLGTVLWACVPPVPPRLLFPSMIIRPDINSSISKWYAIFKAFYAFLYIEFLVNMYCMRGVEGSCVASCLRSPTSLNLFNISFMVYYEFMPCCCLSFVSGVFEFDDRQAAAQ